jgi:hypothetical protein
LNFYRLQPFYPFSSYHHHRHPTRRIRRCFRTNYRNRYFYLSVRTVSWGPLQHLVVGTLLQALIWLLSLFAHY